MYHFEYADKVKVKEQRKELEKLLHEVQDEVRDRFTFQYHFIGSSARNMITFDPKTNQCFDFDVNLKVDKKKIQFTSEEIRKIITNAFQKRYGNYGYNRLENSTRVFTIRKYNRKTKRTEQSCDIAIVSSFAKGECKNPKYIAWDKRHDNYSWQLQPKGFDLKEKEDWLRPQPDAWNAVRERYLKKKNANQDPNKHSRSLYTEAINEICDKYGFECKPHPTNETEKRRAEGIYSMREVPVINSNYCIKGPFFNTWTNQI